MSAVTLKQVDIHVKFVVADNPDVARNFHTRLAAFVDSLKADFGEVLDSSGRIDVSNYDGPELYREVCR